MSRALCRCGSGLRYEHCHKGKDLNPQYWKAKVHKFYTQKGGHNKPGIIDTINKILARIVATKKRKRRK